VDTRRKKKKRTSKKNVDGRCTSSHENKTFGSRSVVKQKEMVFGFRKTATAVIGPEIDRYKQFTNVAADNIRYAGRKLQTYILGLEYKINFRMHRATDDMINRKRKVQTVNLVRCLETNNAKITSRTCKVDWLVESKTLLH
jgi:hypothetical protein